MRVLCLRLGIFTRIVATCVVAGVAYGLVHDQITAHLCVEYFTVGHPTIVETESPLVLGLLWGVIATWWAGAILGALLGLAATLGPWPSVSAGQLQRPILRLLGAMGLGAAVMGLVGYQLARNDQLYLHPWLIQTIHPTDPAIYQAVWFTHNASYGFAALGALMLSASTLTGRVRAAREGSNAADPRSPGERGSADDSR